MIGRAQEERRRCSNRRHLAEGIGHSLAASAAEAFGPAGSPPYPADRSQEGSAGERFGDDNAIAISRTKADGQDDDDDHGVIDELRGGRDRRRRRRLGRRIGR